MKENFKNTRKLKDEIITEKLKVQNKCKNCCCP